jgi:hypothetical protein
VPEEERALLWSLVWMLQSAKRSRVGGVVRAARKWESYLSCFMKVRLLNPCPGRRGMGERSASPLKFYELAVGARFVFRGQPFVKTAMG